MTIDSFVLLELEILYSTIFIKSYQKSREKISNFFMIKINYNFNEWLKLK